jgi:hypothetical protein
MSTRILVAVLIAFGVLSGLALYHHGYWGIIAPHFRTLAAAQVFCDLVIALSLVLVWMVRDLRAAGKSSTPWIAATLLTGSFAPLIYLLVRRSQPVQTTAR